MGAVPGQPTDERVALVIEGEDGVLLFVWNLKDRDQLCQRNQPLIGKELRESCATLTVVVIGTEGIVRGVGFKRGCQSFGNPKRIPGVLILYPGMKEKLVADLVRGGEDLRSHVEGELPQPVFRRPLPD